MPYIKIAPPVNGRFDKAVLQIAAIMVFPNSETKRTNLESHKFPGRIVNEEAKKMGSAATLSGAILLLAIGTDPKNASHTLSKESLSLHYQNKKGPTSEASLESHWRKFKSVAHLWAAYSVLHDKKAWPDDFKVLPGFPCDQSQLALLLTMAEGFRLRGESLQPARSRKKNFLLDKTITWKLHPSVRLEIKKTFEIQFHANYFMVDDALAKRSGRYSQQQDKG